MKNNRKFLTVLLTVLFVTLAACGNSSEESGVQVDNQSQSDNSTQNTNDDSSNVDSTENPSSNDNTDTDANDVDNNNANEKVDTSNNVPTKEEDPSAKTTAGLKEEYLKKLNDTEIAVEEIRKKYSDDTSTYAMKKVEGDRYDLWDTLLNEIYGILKEQLPSEEMVQLKEEQRYWIKHRDETAKEASLKYKGGTAEQLEYVAVLANLTEERCHELVEDYMK